MGTLNSAFDDLSELAPSVLAHKLVLGYRAVVNGKVHGAHTVKTMPRRLVSFTAVVLAALAITFAAMVPIPAPAGAATTTAAAVLSQLKVRAEVTSPAYNRDLFPHWVDADRDCQNTRAEVLIAETLTPVTFTTTARCTIATGEWTSWYDGATWTSAADLDVDHVVALKEAWDSGAASWTTARRQEYANDLGVTYALEAVTDNVNQSKSDQDPSTWLPPLVSVRCRYATNWALIKWRWRLSIDAAERTVLAGILSGPCGSEPVTLPSRP